MAYGVPGLPQLKITLTGSGVELKLPEEGCDVEASTQVYPLPLGGVMVML